MSNWKWDKFIQVTKNRQPINYLIEAVKILGFSRNFNRRALDIGCGAGIDAKYLAENKFEVEAIDLNRDSIKQAKKVCAELSVLVIRKNITNYKILPNVYHLIISWNTLSFLTKKDSHNVLIDIQEGLKKGGIFVFGLFGPEDDWAKNHKEMSFWSTDELKKLL